MKTRLEKSSFLQFLLLMLVLLSTCMVIGDGILTPAISGECSGCSYIMLYFSSFLLLFLLSDEQDMQSINGRHMSPPVAKISSFRESIPMFLYFDFHPSNLWAIVNLFKRSTKSDHSKVFRNSLAHYALSDKFSSVCSFVSGRWN